MGTFRRRNLSENNTRIEWRAGEKVSKAGLMKISLYSPPNRVHPPCSRLMEKWAPMTCSEAPLTGKIIFQTSLLTNCIFLNDLILADDEKISHLFVFHILISTISVSMEYASIYLNDVLKSFSKVKYWFYYENIMHCQYYRNCSSITKCFSILLFFNMALMYCSADCKLKVVWSNAQMIVYYTVRKNINLIYFQHL